MRQPADIDPNEFDGLNREFYNADPAEVVERRLWMLVRFLGDEGLEANWSPADISLGRSHAPVENERVQFAALEGMLIMHHAAETLLRLCLAHWDNAPCPWWELTRLRQPRVFPQKVQRLSASLHSDETLSELLRIVSWSGDQSVMAASGTWANEDGWDRHRTGLRDLIDYCCDVVLKGGDLYNAGKHGLAILPTETSFRLDDGELLAESGPSLTVIERAQVDGDARWAKVTHWVKYQRAIAITALIASAVRSLWQCGKQRRVGGADQQQIVVFDSEIVHAAMFMEARFGANTETMSFTLFDLKHPMSVPGPATS